MEGSSGAPDADSIDDRRDPEGLAASVIGGLKARVRRTRLSEDTLVEPDVPQMADESAGREVVQPVQEYFISFDDEQSPFGSCTHLGTDYGPISADDEPARGLYPLTWKRGKASGSLCIDAAAADTAGMWHSLAGLAGDKESYLDFAKCYPYVRDEYQPKCVGMTIDVQGSGSLKVELKSPDGRVLWWATEELSTGKEWKRLRYSWSPGDLRRVKLLDWVAEPLAQLCVSSVHLLIEMPDIPFEAKVFLISYAKLARSHSVGEGLVRDRAHRPPGEVDSIPASGLFCLATCAAYRMGLVKASFAEQALRKTYAIVSDVPKAKGLLPHLVRKQGGKHRICKGAEYGLIGTSIYYHSMLLAAQMLWDGKTLASLIKAVRKIDFAQLRDGDGYLVHGLQDDGRTPVPASWREWGGETALVLLLEHMATGKIQKPAMDEAGSVRDGIGYIAEIQSLFYPDFTFDEEDDVSGVDWLDVRRALLEEQKRCFSRQWPKSPAATLGFYGLSAGEGPKGIGYTVQGTQTPGKADLIHPHYILMSGALEFDPAAVYRVLRTMESCGLLPPWGMVENFTKELEYLPLLGSLNAAFECISAYHLWAEVTEKRDQIYQAVDYSGLLREAVKVFYPPNTRW